jgi:hypothetical protein
MEDSLLAVIAVYRHPCLPGLTKTPQPILGQPAAKLL